MRNFDVQFDRENTTLRMVRSDCGKIPDPNFVSFYYHHSDARYNSTKKKTTKQPEIPPKVTDEKPGFWIIVVISVVFIGAILIYSVFCNRYRDRETGTGDFNRAEMVYEL